MCWSLLVTPLNRYHIGTLHLYCGRSKVVEVRGYSVAAAANLVSCACGRSEFITLLKILNVLTSILLSVYFLQSVETDCGVVSDITSARYRLSGRTRNRRLLSNITHAVPCIVRQSRKKASEQTSSAPAGILFLSGVVAYNRRTKALFALQRYK